VVSVIGLVVALGGGAYATIRGIPDAKGVFHGCVNNQTRVLRVVKSAKSCRHRRVIIRAGKRIVIPGELAIAWNQTGPKGSPGLQGRPGTNGTNGSPGQNGNNGESVTSSSLSTGDAHCPNGGSSFQSTSGTTFACTGATGTTGPTGPSDAYTTHALVPGLDLAAGSYMLLFEQGFTTTTSAAGDLSCTLDHGTAIDHASAAIPATTGFVAHVAMTVPITLSAEGFISAGCTAGGPTGNFTNTNISAIKVGALHTQ
jgi:hypothetical protein